MPITRIQKINKKLKKKKILKKDLTNVTIYQVWGSFSMKILKKKKKKKKKKKLSTVKGILWADHLFDKGHMQQFKT